MKRSASAVVKDKSPMHRQVIENLFEFRVDRNRSSLVTLGMKPKLWLGLDMNQFVLQLDFSVSEKLVFLRFRSRYADEFT